VTVAGGFVVLISASYDRFRSLMSARSGPILGERHMGIERLLIANRGEVAIRIARGAADLGSDTVAIFSEDDATSLHTRAASQAYALSGLGSAAYLDIDNIVAAATETGCDGVHPGYGFLAENGDFARAVSHARHRRTNHRRRGPRVSCQPGQRRRDDDQSTCGRRRSRKSRRLELGRRARSV